MRNLPIAYYATIAGSLSIAVGLVVVSYGHIRKFAIQAGAAAWEASVIAVTVDALVVLSIAAIGHARGVGQQPPAMAKVALIVGIVATTGANIHHGVDHGWAGIVVSLWVPVAAELAYQLAMAAVRIGPHGHQREGRPVICGHRISVATAMERVHARPVICGPDVPVAMLAVTLVAVRRPAPRDPRPVICTRVVPLATVAATMPRPAVAICGGHLIDVATVVRPLADLRPVICGHVVAIDDVAFPAPLADLRHEICVRPITPAEVIARTVVVPDTPVATEEKAPPAPAKRTTATATATPDKEAREAVVLDWLTDPTADTDRMATATGEEVAALLAARNLGTVSGRTGRRLLRDVRAKLSATDGVAA